MRSYYISSFDEIQRVSLYILIAIMCRDCAKIAILSLSILYRNRIQMIKSRYKGINFRKNYWKSWNCEMIIFILKCKRWRHCNNVIVMTSSRRREISDDALARISLRFVFTLWNKHSKTYSHWKMMPETAPDWDSKSQEVKSKLGPTYFGAGGVQETGQSGLETVPPG